MSRYTGYNQSGFANSTVTVTRAASGGSTPINYDNIFGETVLYLPFDSDINDASSFNHTVTSENGAVLSDTILKYGAGSLFVDDDPERITVTDDGNFNFGTQDFTIEGWFRFTEKDGPARLIHGGNNSSSLAPFLFYLSSEAVRFYSSSDGSNWDISDNKRIADIASTGVWYHLAVTREGDTFRTFQDGTLKRTFTSSLALMDVEDGAIAIGGRPTDLQSLSGYIDDLRIIRGHAKYTASFTAPTSAVGLYSGNPVSLYLPFDSDVQDDSSHTHAVTASGDAAISSTQSKFGGNSLALDGTGDYLTIPSSDTFHYGDGDFTIEMWVYMNTNSSGSSPMNLISKWDDGQRSWAFELESGPNKPRIRFSYDGTSKNVDSTLNADSALTSGQWHHLAFVRSGETLTTYLDGIAGSKTINLGTNSLASPTSSVYIGQRGSARYFNGYIDDVRISKGVARYTKNFVPPSQAVGVTLNGTNETNTTTDFTSLYLPFDSDVNDDSDDPFTITASGDAAISSTKSKFGGYSLGLDGTGDSLSVASSQSAMAFAGDFTIEFWMYPTGLDGSYQVPMGCHNSSGWLFQFANSGGRFWINGSNILNTTAVTSSNQWYHVAVSRSGSSVKLFIDGAEQGSVTYSSAMPTNNDLTIGASPPGNQNFAGYLDDIRILDGYGKYTADFTPPTSAVGTSVSETVNDLTMLYMPFDVTTTSTTTPSSQVEIYVPFESDFGDDGPNSLTLTEAGGGASSGRDVLIDTAPGSVPFGTNAAHFDNSSYSWNNSNSGRLSTSRDVDFGTNDFTIEFWAYIKSSQTNHAVLISTWSSGGWVIQIDSNTSLKFYDSSSNHATSSLPRNQWAHFAVVRASGVITWYVNGSAETTRTNSGNINGVGNLTIGSYPGGVGGYNGWLKDVRIINGTAVYTSDFSVPTAAHGGNGAPTSTTTQGGLEDLARNHGVTKNGDATLNTSVKKFGTSSLYLDGVGDFLTIPNNGDILLEDKDFTIESYVYRTASPSYGVITALWDSTGNQRSYIARFNGHNPYFYYSTTGSSYTERGFTDLTASLNTWHHIAFVRENDTLYCYLDGVKSSSSYSFSGASFLDGTGDFTIGCLAPASGGTNFFYGYIDDLRIIKGKAIYTAAFTAPSSAHGHSSLQTDGSTSETYSDNKFLSGIWDMTDVRDKMMQSTWISNDSRLPNGAGLQFPGGTHRWSGPPPLTTVTMNVIGAAGGQKNPGSSSYMRGGYSTGTIDLSPGTSLSIVVGGGGSGTPGGGGYGGGGPGSPNSSGGGGYSGVFDGPVSQGNALLIAGGGGGSGYAGSPNTSGESPGPGTGDGGGEVGGRGTSNGGSGGTGSNHRGGYGGTQSAGGAGGSSPSPSTTNDGKAGSALQGGQGSTAGGATGGGGGGGYFGGGGGAWKGSDGVGGGGGGSGYVNPSVTGSTTAGGASGSLPTALSPGNYGIGGTNSSGNNGAVEIIDSNGPTVYTHTGGLQTHTVA